MRINIYIGYKQEHKIQDIHFELEYKFRFRFKRFKFIIEKLIISKEYVIK